MFGYNIREELMIMDNTVNVVNAPKTSTFQMRINPDVKRQVEAVYAKQGLTFTDAVNIFISERGRSPLPCLPRKYRVYESEGYAPLAGRSAERLGFRRA